MECDRCYVELEKINNEISQCPNCKQVERIK